MRTVVALLVAVCVAVVTAVLLAFNGLHPATAVISLAAGGAAGLWAWRALRFLLPGQPVRGWAAWAVIAIFALFALRAFGWLIFQRDDTIAFLSPNNLGDLSLHLTLIHYLANGAPFWPANPIFANGPLHYPFGVDLLNSLLLLAGVDTIRGLVWVGLLGSLCTGVMLWRWGGAFTMAGFLFNGGAISLIAFLSTGRLIDFQEAVAWKSIPLALFVTQRGLLYAIPAGLALLWSWRERFLRKQSGLPFAVEWLLYATMPLFHIHTFLFLSGMLGAWGVAALCRRRFSELRPLLTLVGAAFIPAMVLILLLTGGSGKGIHWLPGWMQDSRRPLAFWFENFGFWPLFLFGALVWLLDRTSNEERRVHRALILPATALFLLCCFVMFAAWEWDNTKLFLWCYLATLPTLWQFFTAIRMRVLACVLLFFSGAVSLFHGLTGTGYPLADRHELDALQLALAKTPDLPVTTTFAALPTYNHPLLLLGRKVVLGYEGHLLSHGIDYTRQKEHLTALFLGNPGWEAHAAVINADVLYWGPLEEKEFGHAPALWKQAAPLLAEGPWGRLYDLRPLVKGQKTEN